jgi:hypothetical protein
MSTDRYILDDAGNPVAEPDLIKWAQWFEEHNAARRVRRDDLGLRGTVSTIFLGINHNFGDGPPVLWETMVFGGPYDREMWRFSKREMALAGHEDVVRKLVDLQIIPLWKYMARRAFKLLREKVSRFLGNSA